MPKKQKIVQVVPSIPSICLKINISSGLCGVCQRPVFEWEKIVETNDVKGNEISFNPWVSRGHYSEGSYSTWNPEFVDRRIYLPYCYKCWYQYSDYIIISDGFYYNNGLHLVTNWSFEKNIKVKRTSGEIQDGNEFFTCLWNHKQVPENEKTDDDKLKEKETIVYCLFNRFVGELMIFVKLKDGQCKPVVVSELQLLNPDLKPFQFRFPNRLPYYKVLQWANKKTEADHEKIQECAWISEWYNPDI